MAIMDPKTALENEKILSFGGVCNHAKPSSNNACEMKNFRILPNGSLEKRCGYQTKYQLGAPIRGVWEGTLSGANYFFAVAGRQVYRMGPTDSSLQSIYSLTTSEGSVRFFY